MSKDNTVEEIILDICKRDGYSDAEANDVLAVFYSEPAIVEALTTYGEQVRREEQKRLHNIALTKGWVALEKELQALSDKSV